MNKPKVSVLMSVFGDTRYLAESVKSILAQTFSDFELLILDDGNKPDYIKGVLSQFADERLQVFRNNTNMGLAFSLNRLIELSSGDYIARMDADDVAEKNRLAVQYDYLVANKHIDVVVGNVSFLPCSGRSWQVPDSDSLIKERLMWGNFIPHPTVFVRKKKMIDHDLFYNPKVQYAQDYELWVRCVEYLNFGSVGEVVLNYRYEGPNEEKRKVQQKVVRNSQKLYFKKYFKLKLSLKEIDWICGANLSLLGILRLTIVFERLIKSKPGFICGKSLKKEVHDRITTYMNQERGVKAIALKCARKVLKAKGVVTSF